MKGTQLGWRFPPELPERGRRVCLGELLCETDLEKPLAFGLTVQGDDVARSRRVAVG
jgi:hypothetical protein